MNEYTWKEYLLTYGWAVLIIVIVIAAIWKMGVFKITINYPGDCVYFDECYKWNTRVRCDNYRGIEIDKWLNLTVWELNTLQWDDEFGQNCSFYKKECTGYLSVCKVE